MEGMVKETLNPVGVAYRYALLVRLYNEGGPLVSLGTSLTRPTGLITIFIDHAHTRRRVTLTAADFPPLCTLPLGVLTDEDMPPKPRLLKETNGNRYDIII